MDSFPNLQIWNHAVFKSTEYKDFREELKVALMEEEVPESVRLCQAVPEMATILQSMQTSQKTTHQVIANGLKKLTERVDELSNKRFRITLDVTCGKDNNGNSATFVANTPPIGLEDAGAIAVQAANVSLVNPPVNEGSTEVEPQSEAEIPGRLPFYKMSRNLKTITDAWGDFVDGINGGPSIQSLNNQWGCKWRLTTAERKFYSRRLKLYTKIQEKAQTDRTTTSATAVALENDRTSLGKSLDWYQKNQCE